MTLTSIISSFKRLFYTPSEDERLVSKLASIAGITESEVVSKSGLFPKQYVLKHYMLFGEFPTAFKAEDSSHVKQSHTTRHPESKQVSQNTFPSVYPEVIIYDDQPATFGSIAEDVTGILDAGSFYEPPSADDSSSFQDFGGGDFGGGGSSGSWD